MKSKENNYHCHYLIQTTKLGLDFHFKQISLVYPLDET